MFQFFNSFVSLQTMSPVRKTRIKVSPQHHLPLKLLCNFLLFSFIILIHLTPGFCQFPYNPNAYHEDINSIPVYRDQRQRFQKRLQPNYQGYQEWSPYGFKSDYENPGHLNLLGDGNYFYPGPQPRPRFGQPIPSYSFEDPAQVWEETPEERESKRQNPLPYIINPGIRRATSSLGQLEAFTEKGSPTRQQVLKPLLNLVLNPSKR